MLKYRSYLTGADGKRNPSWIVVTVLKKGTNTHSFFLFLFSVFRFLLKNHTLIAVCRDRKWVLDDERSSKWNISLVLGRCICAQDEARINKQQALRDYRCTARLTVAFIIFHYSYYLFNALVGLPLYYSCICQPPPSLNPSGGFGCRGVKACSVFKCDFQQCPGSGR